MEWSKLSMPERAEYIRLGVKNGITNINTIRKIYNKYAKGGYIGDENHPIQLDEVVVTPQSVALNRSRMAKKPNADFSHAQDMNGIQRFGANYLAGVPFIGVDPHTCLNTVTGFYDPDNTVASNPNIVANPKDYGYRKISQSDAVPGDLIILSNGEGHPKHAVMFDSVSEGYGIHNGYNYAPGDTLVNYSNGGRGDNDYRLQGPLPRFDDPEMAGGDFSGPKTYLRYTGKRKVNKKYNGGSTIENNDRILSTGNEYVDMGLSFVPFVGSAMDIEEAIRNPTFGNVLFAVGSTAADFLGGSLIKGAINGGIKAAKAVNAYNEAERATKLYTKALHNATINPTKGTRKTARRRFREAQEAKAALRSLTRGRKVRGRRRVSEKRIVMPSDNTRIINPYTVYGTDFSINALQQMQD